MSDTLLTTIQLLEQLVQDLQGEAATLDAAADVLRSLHESERHKQDLADAKERAARWNVRLPFP